MGISLEQGVPREPAVVHEEDKIEQKNYLISDRTDVKTITSSKSYQDALSAKLGFDLTGYGGSVQASFSHSKDFKLDSNQIIFYATRKIQVGYIGYNVSNPPSMNESAKSFLKKYGPERFARRYGTHFVAGTNNGA